LVLLQRHLAVAPGVLHGLDDAPALHCHFAAYRQGGVALEYSLQDVAVGRQLAGAEVALHGHRIYVERVARAADVQVDPESVGVQGDADVQPVWLGAGRPGVSEPAAAA
jgi:hypothetical protein